MVLNNPSLNDSLRVLKNEQNVDDHGFHEIAMPEVEGVERGGAVAEGEIEPFVTTPLPKKISRRAANGRNARVEDDMQRFQKELRNDLIMPSTSSMLLLFVVGIIIIFHFSHTIIKLIIIIKIINPFLLTSK